MFWFTLNGVKEGLNWKKKFSNKRRFGIDKNKMKVNLKENSEM